MRPISSPLMWSNKMMWLGSSTVAATTSRLALMCMKITPLMPATMVDDKQVHIGKADRQVDSLCPYCGVGCQATFHVKDNKIVVRRDWKTDADKIKGAFAIARDLAEHVIAKEKTAKKAKAKG